MTPTQASLQNCCATLVFNFCLLSGADEMVTGNYNRLCHSIKSTIQLHSIVEVGLQERF